MGTQPIDDYCREIESYLCRKNDGHLIRVVGPSFQIVSAWATHGVPLKVALRGIDRYFERYYAKGPRRRPVKIDFCDADVQDVFDEWRRALGLTALRAGDAEPDLGTGETEGEARESLAASHPSLPSHLERVVRRLTSARASDSLGAEFDALIDRVALELDIARAKTGGLRGAARQALVDRLAAIDAELIHQASAALDETTRTALAREADEDLAGFRAAMPADAFDRARAAAVDRLVRERFGLPTISFA